MRTLDRYTLGLILALRGWCDGAARRRVRNLRGERPVEEPAAPVAAPEPKPEAKRPRRAFALRMSESQRAEIFEFENDPVLVRERQIAAAQARQEKLREKGQNHGDAGQKR